MKNRFPSSRRVFIKRASFALPFIFIPRLLRAQGSPSVVVVNGLRQTAEFILPSNYDSAKSYQLVIYFHGAGEDYTAPLADPLKADMMTDIVESGRIVCASTAHGDNWGNQPSIDDNIELLTYAFANFLIIPNTVVAFSQSMGGVSGLVMVGNRSGVSTNITGWLGIYPVCNLLNLYSLGVYTGEINTAYGISGDYSSKTAGHDPHLLSASGFNGLRTIFFASPGDTVVPKAQNTDLMQALVAPVTLESGVIVCSGDHGDPSHFQTTPTIQFLNRVRGDSRSKFPARKYT